MASLPRICNIVDKYLAVKEPQPFHFVIQAELSAGY
jgi:hypothetical protein